MIAGQNKRERHRTLLQQARTASRDDGRTLIMVPQHSSQRCVKLDDLLVGNLINLHLQTVCPSLPSKPLDQIRRDGCGHVFIQLLPEPWANLDTQIDTLSVASRTSVQDKFGSWTLDRPRPSVKTNKLLYVIFGIPLDDPLIELPSSNLSANSHSESVLSNDVEHVVIPQRLNHRKPNGAEWVESTVVQFGSPLNFMLCSLL